MDVDCRPFIQDVRVFKLLRSTGTGKQEVRVPQEVLKIIRVDVRSAMSRAATVVNSSAPEA